MCEGVRRLQARFEVVLGDDDTNRIFDGCGRGHPRRVVNRGEFAEYLVGTDHAENNRLTVELLVDLDLTGFDDECRAALITIVENLHPSWEVDSLFPILGHDMGLAENLRRGDSYTIWGGMPTNRCSLICYIAGRNGAGGGMRDVGQWLEGLDLGQYAEVFRENDIEFDLVSELTEDDLRELGLSLGHRRKLLRAIADLSDGSDPAPTAETDTTAPPTGSETPRSDAERRQLTVMFCDLVGSTAMSEALDLEDLRTVIATYQEACAGVIARYEGFIARYMGDGLLVYFGYPVAHEDDAERAVRVGLDVLAAVPELKVQTGLDIQIRIGIATGLVVAGDIIGEGASEERAVLGETPNLAARLQSLAEPNTIVISAETRQLASDVFSYDDLGTHELKGFSEPVQTWRVSGEHRTESRFEAVRGGHLSPLVGRDNELALLLDRWESAKNGEGQVVLLSGEAGIGKSRITQALRDGVAGEEHVRVRYQCSPFHINSAFYPVINQLQFAAGIDAADTSEQKLTKLEGVLAEASDGPTSVAPIFASLLSIPSEDRYGSMELSPQELKQKTLTALTDELGAHAAGAPVLLIVEDAHWMDPSTLELMDLALQRIAEIRVLGVMTFRPEFTPPWAGHAHLTALSLNRLARNQGMEIVRGLTGGKGLPDKVMEQILQKTDGVPLFVEELTKTVLESGLLKESEGAYIVEGTLPALAVPNTLQDSLMARLDRMAPVREVAQVAATIGREFSLDLLAAVAERSEEDISEALDQLADSELIFRRGVTPHQTFSFKHALVQDAAYASLLISRRKQLHARIAGVMADRYPEIVQTQPELLAHHLTESGLIKAAIERWQQAATLATRRSANPEAVAHLERALDLISTVPESEERDRQELSLLIGYTAPLIAARGYMVEELARATDRAQKLSEKLGEAEQIMPVLYGQWAFQLVAGTRARCIEIAEAILRPGKRSGDIDARMIGHRLLGTVSVTAGAFETARQNLESSLELYDHDRHGPLAFQLGQDFRVGGQNFLAQALWCLGFPAKAVEQAREGIDFARSLSHPNTLAYALNNGGTVICALREDLDGLEAGAQEMFSIGTEHGLQMWQGVGMLWTAWVKIMRGDVEAGVEGLIQVQDALYRRARMHYLMPWSFSKLATGHTELRQFDAAAAAIAEAKAIMERSGERWLEGETHRVEGDLHLADGANLAEAEACYTLGLSVTQEQGARGLELKMANSLANLWVDQGKKEEARDLLQPIYETITDGFEYADLSDAREILEALG